MHSYIFSKLQVDNYFSFPNEKPETHTINNKLFIIFYNILYESKHDTPQNASHIPSFSELDSIIDCS